MLHKIATRFTRQNNYFMLYRNVENNLLLCKIKQISLQFSYHCFTVTQILKGHLLDAPYSSSELLFWQFVSIQEPLLPVSNLPHIYLFHKTQTGINTLGDLISNEKNRMRDTLS